MYLGLHSPTRYFFLAAALLIAPTTIAWGEPVGSSCARANLPANNFYQGEFDRESLPAFVVGAQVPVYAQKRSDGAPVSRLTFGSRVFIVEPADGSSGTRAQVADYSDVSNIYGWVDQSSLLCRHDPLRLDNGLWRRAFIQTKTWVYEDSQGGCEGDACREISDFAWLFIYAERDGKLLVSESAQLRGGSTNIHGWLDSNDAILWNTASALRPSEKLDDVYPEDYVCAYPSPESINDPEQCLPVLGGERWFESGFRLPILDDTGYDDTGYWRVALIGQDSSFIEPELLKSLFGADISTSDAFSGDDVEQTTMLYNSDMVQELYILKSEGNKLVREVLVTDSQFNDWQGVLNAFRYLMPGRQAREHLFDVLNNRISFSVGINLEDTTDSDKPMGEILRLKAGLPYGFDSPILQYSEKEIRESIPTCELAHVVEVAVSHLALFDAIEQGNGLPVFSYEPADTRICTTMTDKGRALRKINQLEIMIKPLNTPIGAHERSFLFSANNDRFYWLPIEWLP